MSALAKYMLKKKATVVDGHKHMWEGLKDFGKKNKGKLAGGVGLAALAGIGADEMMEDEDEDEEDSRMKKLRKYLEA